MLFRYDQIKDRDDITVEEMTEWCNENLTDDEVTVGNFSIFIKSETDATAFKLRWL